MLARARSIPPVPRGPRLVVDAPAGPRVRFRAWEADATPEQARRAHAPSAHAAVELAWIDEGQVAYGIGSVRHEIPEGCAMMVPSDVEHATLFPTIMRGAAIWIDRDLVAEVSDALGRRSGPVSGIVARGARIARLGAVLAEEVKANDRGALLAADAIVEAMLVTALRDEPELACARAPREPAIAAAVRFLEASYAEPVGVDEMARVARMSRFHFSRRFREATGKSPYRYLVDVRLERAAELLRRGHASVTEAALTVGFSDPSRFARMFRGRFGVSPARYSACSAGRARVMVSAT